MAIKAEQYDVAVIGLGAMGSAAAYHLAARGLRVCGIEQFEQGHGHGSSNGDSRIVRKAYFENPAYVPLLHRAYELWEELEQVTGESLLIRCGFITAGLPGSEAIRNLHACYQAHQIPHEYWTADTFRNAFPQFHLPQEMMVFYDPSGGYLRVSACIDAHLQQARRHGAVLLHGEQVTYWEALPGEVAIFTANRKILAEKVVITIGAWAGQVLGKLNVPLEISRRVQFWYQSPEPQQYFAEKFPSFYIEDKHAGYYGCPAIDDYGVKIGEHMIPHTIDSPQQKEAPITASEESTVLQFIAKMFPDLIPEPTRQVTCLYTLTPDRHFVIDRHPEHPNVVFAAGFSGHGFKFAGLVGEIMADLAISGQTQHPVEFLRLRSFSPSPESQ